MTAGRFVFGSDPFYFLRHGETHANQQEIVQGQQDTELNQYGRGSAELAARSLASVPLGSIYASPLKRAWTTAFIISVLTAAPVFPLPAVKERHWGKYQGQYKSQRPAVENPRTAEPLEAFEARVLEGMRSITGPMPVLVVAHSGVFRVICRYAGLALDPKVSIVASQVLKLVPASSPGGIWRISVAGRPE